MKVTFVRKVEKIARELDGVFRLSDLRVLFAGHSAPALYKMLNGLVREAILVKVRRGLYAQPSASLDVISQRITPESYLSMGTVLAEHLLIGSIPARRAFAVKVGRPLSVTCDLGTIEHFSIKPELFFGFETREGIRRALPEKAFLDACYFHYKGREFSFDLGEDVNRDALDRKRLATFLKAYDPRFITHYLNTWGHA